jgi:hypothetical protein
VLRVQQVPVVVQCVHVLLPHSLKSQCPSAFATYIDVNM